MSAEKEKEFVVSLREMMAMLPESNQKVRVDKKVSGTIMFLSAKVFVFGLKGQPDSSFIHAIVDRINNMIVGLFFSSKEYVRCNELRYNILYRLQPFVFLN